MFYFHEFFHIGHTWNHSLQLFSNNYIAFFLSKKKYFLPNYYSTTTTTTTNKVFVRAVVSQIFDFSPKYLPQKYNFPKNMQVFN